MAKQSLLKQSMRRISHPFDLDRIKYALNDQICNLKCVSATLQTAEGSAAADEISASLNVLRRAICVLEVQRDELDGLSLRNLHAEVSHV